MTKFWESGFPLRLNFRWPRLQSVRGLIAVAVVITSIPLLGSNLYSQWSAHTLLGESRALISQGVRLAALGESLGEVVLTLERSARQYSVLEEPAIKRLLRERRDQLREIVDAMLVEEPSTESRALLEGLRRMVSRPTVRRIPADGTEDLPRRQEDAFDNMRDAANSIRTANRIDLASQLRGLVDREAATRRGVVIWSIALMLLSIGIALVFARLISAPVKQILLGIRKLGKGELNEVIAVTGPVDLEAVGSELNWLRRRLRSVDDEKNTFMRQMSHDLKTPLTNIREGSAQLLAGDQSVADRDKISAIIQRNARKLDGLITRLLDYAAWQHQPASAVLQRFDLIELISQVLGEHELQLNSRGLEVQCKMPQGLSIRADPARIHSLFDNLLSNAIKYSPPGGAIYLRVQTTDDHLVIDVRDEGLGFNAADKTRAFEPFYRGRTGVNAAISGTGIGLSVARACVRTHEGSIEICDAAAQHQGVAAGGHVRVKLPATCLD